MSRLVYCLAAPCSMCGLWEWELPVESHGSHVATLSLFPWGVLVVAKIKLTTGHKHTFKIILGQNDILRMEPLSGLWLPALSAIVVEDTLVGVALSHCCQLIIPFLGKMLYNNVCETIMMYDHVCRIMKMYNRCLILSRQGPHLTSKSQMGERRG